MKKNIIGVMLGAACFISAGALAGEGGDSSVLNFVASVNSGTCTAPTDFINKAFVPLGQVGQEEIPASNNGIGRPWQKSFTFTGCSSNVSKITASASWEGQGGYTSYIANKGTATNIVSIVFTQQADQGNEGKRLYPNTLWDIPVQGGIGTVTLYGNLMRWGTGVIGNGTLNFPVNLTVVYH